MEFNGFQVYPAGNAQLNVEEGKLKVSDVSESGLDGVLINVEGKEGCTINFDTLQEIANNDGVLQATTLARNSFGQVLPFLESFTWFDKSNDKYIFGYNPKFLPEQYDVVGWLNGEEVFRFKNTEIESPDPRYPADAKIAWIIPVVVAVIAAGAAVFAAVYTKTTTTRTDNYDGQGHLLSYTIVTIKDPLPFEIEVNGNKYAVTDFGLDYTIEIPEELIGKEIVNIKIIAEQITGYKISNFGITSIES